MIFVEFLALDIQNPSFSEGLWGMSFLGSNYVLRRYLDVFGMEFKRK